MAKKRISGISGVLEELITTRSAAESTATKNSTPEADRAGTIALAPVPGKIDKARSCARLGRPPGPRRKPTPPKDKVTLRIDAELLADYREWSWDERCQLGELVERALIEFRKRFHSRR